MCKRKLVLTLLTLLMLLMPLCRLAAVPFEDSLNQLRQSILDSAAQMPIHSKQNTPPIVQPQNFDERTADVIEKAMPAVVTVVNSSVDVAKFSLLAKILGQQYKIRMPGTAVGTGFVVRSDGLLVTNAHVVGPEAVGKILTVQFSDHISIDAMVVAENVKMDLALLQIRPSPVQPYRRQWPALPLGDSSFLRQGYRVIALGSPLVLRQSAALGIISAVNRRELRTYPGSYIQTDAALNPGNSGGPLVDMEGRVVGVNFAIPNNSLVSGIGFTIPVEYVKLALKQWDEKGRLANAYSGMIFGGRRGRGGALREEIVAKITGVQTNSPAQKAGLKSGDKILELEGTLLPRSSDDAIAHVLTTIAGKSPGETLSMVIERDGARMPVLVTLGEEEEEDAN